MSFSRFYTEMTSEAVIYPYLTLSKNDKFKTLDFQTKEFDEDNNFKFL